MTKPKYRSRKSIQESMDSAETSSSSASTCVAHLVLAGTSGWAIKYCDPKWSFPYVSYIMLFGHSIIGAAYYGHPSPSETVKKICKVSTAFVESCPIPFLTSQLLLLKAGPDVSALLYMPAITSVLPIASSYFMEENDHLVIDITVGLNLCVLLYYAIQIDSSWAYGLFTLGILNQFVFSQICQKYEVPRMDLVAVGLTFFCIFSINSLCDAIM